MRASRATAPASIARPPVSLLTGKLLVYCFHSCVPIVFLCQERLINCCFVRNFLSVFRAFILSSFFGLGLKCLFTKLAHYLVPTASPPKTVTLDEVMESARDLSNLSLAHEITVNRSFHLEPNSLPQDRYTMKAMIAAYCIYPLYEM